MKRKFTSLLMTVGLLSLLVGAAVPAMVDGNAAVSGAIVAETTWVPVNDAARAPSRGLVMEIPTRPVEPWIRVGSASAKDHQVDDGPVVWGMESHWPALTSSQLNRAADGYSENGGTISGHVYQADGETAIEGATVVVFPGEGEPLTWTLSGADGSYTTPDLPAGEYHLWALAEGYAGEWYQEAYSRADAVAVQVTPPDNVPGVDFTLEPGSSVSGQISRSDDQSPIEGARILAIGLDRFPYAVGWSEADGSYTTTGLLDGQYRILAQVEGYVDKWYDGAYGAHDAAVLTITDDRSGIDFSLEIGGTISGRAVDSGTSQGISDLHINAHNYESGQWVAGANTDHDGYYTLTVPTGSYRVGAHPAVTGLNYAGKLYDDKYHWHEADPVYVTAPGNTPDINFGLEPTVPRDTIEDAIADGAAWLASQQNPDGSWGTYYQVTKTALAVLTLQTHAADLGMSEDPEYPYREHIDQGFSFLLSHAYITGVTPQPAGNPDSNGNGIGVYFRSPVFPPDRGHAYDTYETSIALMAIGASTEPGRIVDVPGSVVDGWSFAGVAQDVVDYLAWGQTDFGFGRGGWNYHPMDFEGERSDQSNTGWVTLGLMYAEDFGATIPHFVKSEIDIWIDYIQDKSGGPDDGGSWYTGPADPDPPIIGANLLRTGNLLQQMAFVGDTESTPRVQAAVDYLVRNWWSYPNCYHTTYTIMKGLEQLAIETVDSIDWFQDFAHAIMNQQRADGGWMPGGFDYAARVLSTTWALLTLQTEIPPTKMGPDLIIAENDAEWVDEGQGTYQVHFTVKNRGNVEAPAGHHVGLVVNDVLIEEKVVPVVLAPGDTYSGIFGTVVTLALPHDKITVCADIYEVIDELNEENNCLTNYLPPAYPDLVISEKYEAWHVEGESYTVHYTVENIGVGPALYGHYVGLRVNGVWIEHRPVPVVLAAGEAYSDSFHTVITLSPVGDEITVCADIYGYVDELDEENNCLTNTLWLEPAWTEFITDPEGDQFHGYGPDIIGIDFHLDDETIYFRVRTVQPIDQHEVANYMLLDLDLDPSTGFVSDDPEIPTNDIGVDAIALIVPAYLTTAEDSSLPVGTVCPERPLQTGPAHASSADLLGGLLRWDPGVEDFSFVGYLVVFADTHSFSFAIPLDMLDDDGIMAVVNIIGYIGADDFEPTDVAPNEGHGLTFRPTNAIRTLPSAVLPGEEFEVAVTFISPADGFNSIGLLDVAPAGWTVSVNTAWCTPPANAANPAIPWTTDLAEYLWFGPYDAGVAFTAVYQVQVPADAALDTYTFPGGTLEYYLGTEGPYVQAIVGDFQVEVASARIEGQTREVNCDILLGVTLTLYQGDVEIASTVSNPDGYYTLAVPGPGEYSVVASKDGFKNKERTILVHEPTTYTVDFVADYGLIPNAPNMSYVLACINLWQFGEAPCKLTMSTVLAVINAWQFPVDEQAVHFPDPNLEAAIREAISKPTGDVYPSDLEGVTHLWASHRNIVDLTGLEYCVDLTDLYLGYNEIGDISPVAGLISLTHFDVQWNEISDVSPLANLTSLTTLNAMYNQISDISPLANLTDLTWLGLWGNNISDVSPLEGLTSLTTLGLGSNQISNASPLEGLTSLSDLDLGWNQISDIWPLEGLTNLTDLHLSSNQISDIWPLEGLTNLIRLALSFNQISDISPLESLTNLTWLLLNGNQITDPSPVVSLTNLTVLNIGANQISDISLLADLTNLESLWLDDNQISDISSLEGLTSLTTLSISHNQICDVLPLEGLTNLTYLRLWDNQISDISPLDGLTELTDLDLLGNQISDIEPLADLTKLTRLELRWNQIGDVSPLSGLTNIGYLQLSHNQISDISPLENLTSLYWLSLGSNQVSDIWPLEGLTSLTYLDLYSNQISDVSPLSFLTSLTDLGISGNEVSDISHLSSLTDLTRLWAGANQISDVSPLSSLTDLNTLGLYGNQISDIAPLAGLTSLTSVVLWSNQISDISPLVDNPGLGEGDTVELQLNPLSEQSINEYIPALQARGVTVSY